MRAHEQVERAVEADRSRRSHAAGWVVLGAAAILTCGFLIARASERELSASLGATPGAAAPSPTMASRAAVLTDSSPPSSPSDLTTVVVPTGVIVDWHDALDDTEIAGYEIRRDGVVLASVDRATLQFIDHFVVPDATYRYSVIAVDTAGNRSAAVAAPPILFVPAP